MNKKTPIGILACATIMTANTAWADSSIEVSGNVNLTTNYTFRGITQTDKGPAIQGGLDLSHASGFYAGVWGSSVDFSDKTKMELNLLGGYSRSVGQFDLDIGGVYYAYPDSPELPTGTQNFFEVHAGVSTDAGPFEIGTSLSYSPDFYGEVGSSVYWLTEAYLPVTDIISVSAGYGVSEFENENLADEYQDFNIGLSADLSAVELDLRFVDTIDRNNSDDQTVVFSIARTF
ncbi:MAG: TorF family putative porin [Cyanobacteria bacterium P01_F01_bin.3]